MKVFAHKAANQKNTGWGGGGGYRFGSYLARVSVLISGFRFLFTGFRFLFLAVSVFILSGFGSYLTAVLFGFRFLFLAVSVLI